jgi:hypothetical protein
MDVKKVTLDSVSSITVDNRLDRPLRHGLMTAETLRTVQKYGRLVLGRRDGYVPDCVQAQTERFARISWASVEHRNKHLALNALGNRLQSVLRQMPTPTAAPKPATPKNAPTRPPRIRPHMIASGSVQAFSIERTEG